MRAGHEKVPAGCRPFCLFNSIQASAFHHAYTVQPPPADDSPVRIAVHVAHRQTVHLVGHVPGASCLPCRRSASPGGRTIGTSCSSPCETCRSPCPRLPPVPAPPCRRRRRTVWRARACRSGGCGEATNPACRALPPPPLRREPHSHACCSCHDVLLCMVWKGIGLGSGWRADRGRVEDWSDQVTYFVSHPRTCNIVT